MDSEPALAPFSCTYTSHVPEILQRLKCTIAITTYQAGKLVLISAKDEHSLIQLPRTFEKPMGIAEDKERDKIAIACKDEIVVLANSKDLAKFYPNSPGKYDALYMPRATYHTGQLDIHDLNFGENDALFAVNTSFSCIVKIDDNYNFTPYWKPPFIDCIASEDRCHLNGMAMLNGKPKYVTAFNQGNSHQSWRENVTKTGILMDIETNEIILENLAMPHSPRIFNGHLYLLLSATGELIRVNTETRTYEVVVKIDGFVRGMDVHKDYLFVGLSKLRKNSSTFAELDFADAANEAAIVILHLPSGSIAGRIAYQSSLDEIYDVHILADKIRPNVMNTIRPDYKAGLMIPDATFWSVVK